VLQLNGAVCAQLKLFDKAIKYLKIALQKDKKNSIILNNLGNVHKELGEIEGALKYYDLAIKYKPDLAITYCNKGIILYEMNELESAIENYDKAIELDKNLEVAYSYKANCLKELGRYDLSIINYDEAIKLNDKNTEVLHNKSIALLAMNNFSEGFMLYDARWKNAGFNSLRISTTKPKVKNLYDEKNKKILVWSEQGIGDEILFSRMLKDLVNICNNSLILLDKRLHPLLLRVNPNLNLFDKNININEIEYDVHMPIGDLCLYFRNSIASFLNNQNEFLKSDKKKTHIIKENFSKSLNDKNKSNKIICGLSWSSKNKMLDKYKSTSLEELLPILLNKNVEFISIQYGDTKEEISNFNKKYQLEIKEYKDIDNFNDLDGLASLIDACDIVLTVSNTCAHIAGSIGKKTILIAPKKRDLIWYWSNMYEGKNLWYSSVEIVSVNLVDYFNATIKELINK